jgi:Predicted DNA alkylation repair enzyme
MTIDLILQELQAYSDDKRKVNLVKLGIPKESSLGVSTSDIRKIAKKYQKDDELAKALWDSKIHDMKLLSVLLLNPQKATDEKIEYYMNEIYSWDLCDHFCKNYLLKTQNYSSYIDKWVANMQTYYKRAAFTLIAAKVVKDKKINNEDLEHYLNYIVDFSADDRAHVYKAISWALREIGKVSLELQEKAIIVAHNLSEDNDSTKQKIGKMALKELENLIEVPGRSRLINRDSKMGQESI